MLAPLRLPSALLACAVWLAGAPACGEPVPVARLLPLTVTEGRCEFVLPADRADDKYYLILGSTALAKGPFRVTVRTEATDRKHPLPVADVTPSAEWRQRTDAASDRLARLRQQRRDEPEITRVADPPHRRTFSIFIKETGFYDPDSYEELHADLRAVGKHCQVYVDCEHADKDALQPTIEDTVRTFDEAVYPLARKSLGHCLDVDRDGRFTLLFSPKLARMSAGKVALGGFVRGVDFFRDQAAPFGNRCDMMYLNTDLKPGNYLRGIIAHEYAHAVIFSEHVFGEYLPTDPRVDEESWLNEALAHLAEDLHGFGWGNLDYRVSAFLSEPGRYQLVVHDYYAAGLWRSPGHRGATYLFLRWCVDRYGEELPARLIQSNLSGIPNLEAAAHEPFVNLFREWTAAVVVSGGGFAVEGMKPLRKFDLRGPLGGRRLAGPRFLELPLVQGRGEVELAGTSAAYVLLHAPGTAGARVTVAAAPEAALQVSLIRLPHTTGRLSLRREATADGSSRLAVTAADADCTLEEVTWERLLPGAIGGKDTSFRTSAKAGESVRAWFETARLKAGETIVSGPMRLPADVGPLVVKVSGRDAGGRAVSAWLLVEPSEK